MSHVLPYLQTFYSSPFVFHEHKNCKKLAVQSLEAIKITMKQDGVALMPQPSSLFQNSHGISWNLAGG